MSIVTQIVSKSGGRMSHSMKANLGRRIALLEGKSKAAKDIDLDKFVP